jgi:hypothetical protein
MLFDLRGRRRRLVQGVYLTLAVLMGGGLVLFGVGSDVSGGLADIFGGGGGGGGGNDLVKKRIEKNEKKAAAGSEAALKALVRDYYQQATSQVGSTATSFPDDAKADLRKAGVYWERYLKKAEKPDPSLATVAVQVFDVSALNQPKQAQEAARIIAERTNDPSAYLRLVQYAALAGDTRTADLAAQKAVDLAPKDQRKAVKQQAEAFKKPQTQTPPPGG